MGIKNSTLFYYHSQDSLLNLLQDSVKLMLSEIYVNDSLLANDTMNVDSAAIIAANQTLHTHIADIQSQIQSISQAIQIAKNNEADNLSVTNNLISITRQMEANEKVVNDIYLATVSRGIYSLNAVQVTSLENIIYQCPLAGGSAVFKARSLYTLYTMQLWYNDDSLCNLVNMQWRHAQQNTPTIENVQVYPNPTTGDITFDFTDIGTENATIYIYDLQGKQILRKQIDTDSHKVNLSLATFSSGMYLYKVVSGEKSYTGKIVLE